MKIGILTFACDAGRSGMGQYLIHLLREFQHTGEDIEFEVIGHKEELDALLPEDYGYTTRIIGNKWKSPILNILWQNTVLPLLCRKQGYDAVFLPAANRRLPLWLPCPSVGTVHDLSSLHIEGKYDPLRDIYIKRMLPFLIRRLTHVVTISESSIQDIVHYAKYPSDRISLIYLGVDHEVFYPQAKEDAQHRVSQKYGIRPPYILYISRIEHPGKNHVMLIRAFARMKEMGAFPHQLVLAGSDWNRAEEVHKAAEASSARDDILFTGFVSGQDLPDLYCGSYLFVFPSLYEGFGMPILEAMACGVPVASSDQSSLPEVAGDAAAFFSPDDEQGLADTLAKLLSDDSTRSLLVEAGLNRAAKFKWKTTAKQTLDALKKALERS